MAKVGLKSYEYLFLSDSSGNNNNKNIDSFQDIDVAAGTHLANGLNMSE